MQGVLAVSFCDRLGFNTKSILLQSAITMCWLKQMAAINGTAGPSLCGLMAPRRDVLCEENSSLSAPCLCPSRFIWPSLFFTAS